VNLNTLFPLLTVLSALLVRATQTSRICGRCTEQQYAYRLLRLRAFKNPTWRTAAILRIEKSRYINNFTAGCMYSRLYNRLYMHPAVRCKHIVLGGPTRGVGPASAGDDAGGQPHAWRVRAGRWSNGCQDTAASSRLINGGRPPSWILLIIFNFSTTDRCKRPNLRHRAKVRQDRSIRC